MHKIINLMDDFKDDIIDIAYVMLVCIAYVVFPVIYLIQDLIFLTIRKRVLTEIYYGEFWCRAQSTVNEVIEYMEDDPDDLCERVFYAYSRQYIWWYNHWNRIIHKRLYRVVY